MKKITEFRKEWSLVDEKYISLLDLLENSFFNYDTNLWHDFCYFSASFRCSFQRSQFRPVSLGSSRVMTSFPRAAGEWTQQHAPRTPSSYVTPSAPGTEEHATHSFTALSNESPNVLIRYLPLDLSASL